jgi:transcription elongation factor GreB
MARALLKKQVDDEVMVITPAGKAFWIITNIEYQQS